ncbi:hypothetical protein SAMN02745126_01766 [Enhydrobacter aerosaccus]|uniref:Apea-like HEPN domain-containing protein n=1 Tax=Enhydrobacter aerosaccus TaxID=225324 RepID=A0A1T4LXG1_9HYPH|nr:hypothetical protein [Enhydrobacter aerosaccus]SJZ59433.1 hypothetical protein SAMN02745126_01766 [Enhydrobacter aerosaccus]
MTSEQEKLCRRALDGMKTICLPGPFPLGADDLGTILEENDIRNASINLRERTVTGFSAGGIDAIVTLAKTFRPSRSEISRRASNATLAKLLFDYIIGHWTHRVSTSLTQPDLDQLQTVVDDWFASLTEVREHVVPCILFPHAVPKFTIGPVTFRHISEPPTNEVGGAQGAFQPENGDFRFSSLMEFATNRNAPWMAFVKVTGRPTAESIHAADTATDVALAVVQLVSPGQDMRGIARASARTAPLGRVDASWAENGGFSEQLRNQIPALARPQKLIVDHIKEVEPVLRSMGQRLTAFLDASSSVPDLDEAWCNAAYWYHEALAETLDTVAVAKLETAIEVLFRAENMSGSKRRLHESFDVFFSLGSSDPIVENGKVTVQQFVEAITTARSRVLHGTWPTLGFDLPANKSNQTISYGDVELLTRFLLISFSAHLDAYIKTGNPTDTTDAFFAWIKAERAAEAAKAAAAPPTNEGRD